MIYRRRTLRNKFTGNRSEQILQLPTFLSTCHLRSIIFIFQKIGVFQTGNFCMRTPSIKVSVFPLVDYMHLNLFQELCGKGGIILLARLILNFNIPTSLSEQNYFAAAVSRMKSKVLSIVSQCGSTISCRHLSGGLYIFDNPLQHFMV